MVRCKQKIILKEKDKKGKLETNKRTAPSSGAGGEVTVGGSGMQANPLYVFLYCFHLEVHIF